MLFETMIFPVKNGKPSPLEDYQDRCSTYDQAIAMHDAAVEAKVLIDEIKEAAKKSLPAQILSGFWWVRSPDGWRLERMGDSKEYQNRVSEILRSPATKTWQ